MTNKNFIFWKFFFPFSKIKIKNFINVFFSLTKLNENKLMMIQFFFSMFIIVRFSEKRNPWLRNVNHSHSRKNSMKFVYVCVCVFVHPFIQIFEQRGNTKVKNRQYSSSKRIVTIVVLFRLRHLSIFPISIFDFGR